MAGLLRQAQQMQQQLIEAQATLARTEVQGSAGGGLVTATVTGSGEVVGLTISPQAYDATDDDPMGSLADLVLAAIRDAGRAASELQATTMGPLTEGLGGGAGGPGLPGM